MRLPRLAILALCLVPLAGCSWYDVMFASLGNAYGESGNAAINKMEYDQKIEQWKQYEQFGPES